jgi:hypothetical protein
MSISFCSVAADERFSNSTLITAAPANVATNPGSTPTSSSGGSGYCNNNGNNGNGNGNCNSNTIVNNVGKSSADRLSSTSKIAIGITVPVVVLALAGFLW